MLLAVSSTVDIGSETVQGLCLWWSTHWQACTVQHAGSKLLAYLTADKLPAKATHGDSKQGKLAVVQGNPNGGKGHAFLLRPAGVHLLGCSITVTTA